MINIFEEFRNVELFKVPIVQQIGAEVVSDISSQKIKGVNQDEIKKLAEISTCLILTAAPDLVIGLIVPRNQSTPEGSRLAKSVFETEADLRKLSDIHALVSAAKLALDRGYLQTQITEAVLPNKMVYPALNTMRQKIGGLNIPIEMREEFARDVFENYLVRLAEKHMQAQSPIYPLANFVDVLYVLQQRFEPTLPDLNNFRQLPGVEEALAAARSFLEGGISEDEVGLKLQELVLVDDVPSRFTETLALLTLNHLHANRLMS